MSRKYLFPLALAWVIAHGALAEVFKCIDEAGQPSYRDTGCRDGESAATIDRRFSNSIPLGFNEDDAELLRTLAEEKSKEAARRVEQRDAEIRSRVRERERKLAKCESLKERYQAMLTRRRHTGRTDPDTSMKLVKQMHEACSG